MANRIDRIFEIIRLLGERGEVMTAGNIADAVGISLRNVMRDLNEIDTMFGFPVLERSHQGYSMAPLNELGIISQREQSAGMGVIQSTPLGALLKPGQDLMNPELSENMKSMVELKGGLPEEQFRRIFTALTQGKYLKIVYKSSDREKTHYCVPVKIFFDREQLYISVYDRDYGHIILLGAGKIRSVHDTKDVLDRAALAKYRAYVNSAWGKMCRHDLKKKAHASFTVDQTIVTYFHRNPIHESQTIIEESLAKYRVEVDVHNPIEFVRWILRFGEHVKVRGDAEVLQEMRDYLSMMLREYQV